MQLELRAALAVTAGVVDFPKPPYGIIDTLDYRAMANVDKFWQELLKFRPKRPGALGALPRGSPVTRLTPSYKLDAIACTVRRSAHPA